MPVPPGAHEGSPGLWRRSTWTFLASANYYDKQEAADCLEVLPRIGHPRRLLDVGWGKGRFTFMLAGYGERVLALDISAPLIGEARRFAVAQAISSTDSQVADILQQPPGEHFQCKFCMGVTSVIIEHHAFEALLSRLVEAASDGGFLLMKDTLSTRVEDEYRHTGSRPTIHHNKKKYLDYLAELGCQLEHAITLIRSAKRQRINGLFLLHVPAPAT